MLNYEKSNYLFQIVPAASVSDAGDQVVVATFVVVVAHVGPGLELSQERSLRVAFVAAAAAAGLAG